MYLLLVSKGIAFLIAQAYISVYCAYIRLSVCGAGLITRLITTTYCANIMSLSSSPEPHITETHFWLRQTPPYMHNSCATYK